MELDKGSAEMFRQILREELRDFARLDDLKDFVTKQELAEQLSELVKNLVNKKEFGDFRLEVRRRLNNLAENVVQLDRRVSRLERDFGEHLGNGHES